MVVSFRSYSGTVTASSNPALNCRNGSGTCAATFSGSTTLVAKANAGYLFDKWVGCTSVSTLTDLTCSYGYCNYSGTASVPVYVYFKPGSLPPPPPPPVLNVSVLAGSGGVTQYFQTPSPNPISCYNNTGTCALSPFTSKVILSAAPDAGYIVEKWTGCAPSADLTICDAGSGVNTAVAIYFKQAPPPPTHILTLLVQGGSGSVSVGDVSCFSADGGLTYNGTCSYVAPDASTLTLTAAPTLGYAVKSWAGCSPSADNSTCSLMLTGDWVVGVTFVVSEPTAPPPGNPDDTNGSLPPP